MDRSIAPAFSSTLDFKFPSYQKIQVGNAPSSSLVLLPYEQTPITKIEFVFCAGKAIEPSPGMAQFTTNLLDKGVPNKSAKEIASTFDYYGAHVELSADSDYATISLYCLAAHAPTLLPLLLEMLSVPTFPTDELEKYRTVFIENLKVNQEKNSYLATVALRQALFGMHAYAHSTDVPDALNISQSSILAFFKQTFLPYKVFVTGQLAAGELQLIANFFNSRANQFKPISTRVEATHTITEVTKPGPGKDQVSIRFGKHTLRRTDAAAGELTLLNHILGGYFGSRLMHNIREEKGLTYGIYSSIQHLNQASTLTIAAEVNQENTEQALHEIKKELIDLQRPLSGEELQKAKNHLIGSIQNDNASIFSISERVRGLELNDLSTTYYTELLNKIAKATPEKLAELAMTHLQPESFSVIAVGG